MNPNVSVVVLKNLHRIAKQMNAVELGERYFAMIILVYMTVGSGAIQVLRNAVGGGTVSGFPEKSITKMYGSTLLALRGGGWVSNFLKKALCNT